jgi:ribonuclease D
LVDALVSGTSGLTAVEVRVLSWAPSLPTAGSRGHGKGHILSIHLHSRDLPDDLDLGPVVAIDCETMGLNPHRDRLCLVQLSSGDGTRISSRSRRARPRRRTWCACSTDPDVLKLFHFGRFDIAALDHTFGVLAAPVYCTKIASKLVRTYTDRHGLKYLLQSLSHVDISKQQQTDDWGAARSDRGADRLCRLGRAVPAPGEGRARRAAGPRGAHRAGAGGVRLPADARRSISSGWPEIDIFAH